MPRVKRVGCRIRVDANALMSVEDANKLIQEVASCIHKIEYDEERKNGKERVKKDAMQNYT